MTFRVLGLDPTPFIPLYGLSESELNARGVKRIRVDSVRSFPDRVEMRDADIGEYVLLMNYKHQPAQSPFQSAHAIYVREGAQKAYNEIASIPDVLLHRTLSVRSFDISGMMIDAELIDGQVAAQTFERLLENQKTAYIHVHNAVRGCYAGRVERV